MWKQFTLLTVVFLLLIGSFGLNACSADQQTKHTTLAEETATTDTPPVAQR